MRPDILPIDDKLPIQKPGARCKGRRKSGTRLGRGSTPYLAGVASLVSQSVDDTSNDEATSQSSGKTRMPQSSNDDPVHDIELK